MPRSAFGTPSMPQPRGSAGWPGRRPPRRPKACRGLPPEEGWYVDVLHCCVGGPVLDPGAIGILHTAPQGFAAFDWIASYARKYGKDSISEDRSGLGNFNPPQKGFLAGAIAMEQQGP